MRLSDLDITQCTQCGRLFQTVPGQALCRRCNVVSEALESEPESPPEGMAELPADLEPSLHGKALRILALFHEETTAPSCVRCRARPPIEDSEFCLSCHLELDDALGSATRELFARMELVETDPVGPPSVLSMLDQKRSRTRTARINPVAARQFRR